MPWAPSTETAVPGRGPRPPCLPPAWRPRWYTRVQPKGFLRHLLPHPLKPAATFTAQKRRALSPRDRENPPPTSTLPGSPSLGRHVLSAGHPQPPEAFPTLGNPGVPDRTPQGHIESPTPSTRRSLASPETPKPAMRRSQQSESARDGERGQMGTYQKRPPAAPSPQRGQEPAEKIQVLSVKSQRPPHMSYDDHVRVRVGTARPGAPRLVCCTLRPGMSRPPPWGTAITLDGEDAKPAESKSRTPCPTARKSLGLDPHLGGSLHPGRATKEPQAHVRVSLPQ